MSRKCILIKQELLLLVYELNRSGLLAENEKIRFFFNDPATTEICALSLHAALPISLDPFTAAVPSTALGDATPLKARTSLYVIVRSEEHTSELQSQSNLVCRLLLGKKMRKFDLSLRSSRSSYFATFRHQLTILSNTDALDEEKWLNMLGTFVKDWFRYESHFVHGRDSLVDILKERGLLSESDAVQPLIGKKS